jgi:hypothetical protein
MLAYGEWLEKNLWSPTACCCPPGRFGCCGRGLADRMRQWHHAGFSVHNRIRTQAADAEGRQRLARYMIRKRS